MKYDENDQESICNFCESHFGYISRDRCQGSRCTEATEMFYDDQLNIDDINVLEF